tara:strand:+ start:55 stop:486 length:432 start_codon:yes stop_codon:yes gene_type:complete
MDLNLSGINQYSNPSSSAGMNFNTFSDNSGSSSGSGSGSSGSRPERTRAGFFGAVANAADDRAKRDEDLDAKAQKAKELAKQYQKSTLKVGPDISVMEGDSASEFTMTNPGRKGFGGIIGAGLGYAMGGPMGAQVGQSIGGAF